MTEKSQPRLISSASFDPRKLLPPVSSQIASSRFVLPWLFGPHSTVVRVGVQLCVGNIAVIRYF